MSKDALIPLLVAARRSPAPDVAEFKLVSALSEETDSLPAADAGAHLTLRTPSGAMRRYSLTQPSDGSSYVIAVKREPASRGGSASVHEALHSGDIIHSEPPQNDFPLAQAPEHILIAGGIGVTPILAMVRALTARGTPCRMVYCVRERATAAYIAELESLLGDRLKVHEDGGRPDRMFDFWNLLGTPTRAHVMCCGPAGLMDEVRAVSGHWPEGAVRYENFRPVEATRPDDAPFRVVLARSGRKVDIPAGRTILETLREEGVDVRSSCESGTCGTCRTRLLEGKADHRDTVLTAAEHSANIMICVSRACTGALVLDL